MKLSTLTPEKATALDLERAVVEALPGARVEVATAQPGHFRLTVTSADFAGKNPLARQRLVYKAIAPLMKGPSAPVHAIDELKTLEP